MAPLVLLSVGSLGAPVATTALAAPLTTYAGRLALRDQSFLMATLGGTDAGTDAVEVQHFTPDGAPLAGPAEVTGAAIPPEIAAWGSPLVMAETGAGVLSAWPGPDPASPSGSSVFVRPLDRDGHPTGPAGPLAALGNDSFPPVTLAPAPDGDVVLAWYEIDAGSTYHLFAMGLGPDGAPRGPATALGTFGFLREMRVLVSPDGQRALLGFSGDEAQTGLTVFALPLACVP